jgi:hypothetical protein
MKDPLPDFSIYILHFSFVFPVALPLRRVAERRRLPAIPFSPPPL